MLTVEDINKWAQKLDNLTQNGLSRIDASDEDKRLIMAQFRGRMTKRLNGEEPQDYLGDKDEI